MSERLLIFRQLILFFLLPASFTTCVCAQVKASGPSDQTGSQQARKQLEDLREAVSNLRKEIETLKSKLEVDEYFLGTKQTRSDSISLDLTSRNYQRLDTDNGFFLVSVGEAQPYLNGYKIQLRVGNPSSATYKDYKLKVKFSKSYDWGKYTQASYDEWTKAVQEKEISFPGSLEAGTWNNAEVILAPVNADQLGYLTLSMETNTVYLHTQ